MKPNDQAIEAAATSLFGNYMGGEKKWVGDAIAAAYAAQFPPSDDYAGLLKMLRSMHKQITSAIEKADPWGITDETVPGKAADALVAVLAERDAAKRSAYEDAARFIEENVLNYSSGDQNYWSHRKGDNTHGLEYAREFREKAAAIRSGK